MSQKKPRSEGSGSICRPISECICEFLGQVFDGDLRPACDIQTWNLVFRAAPRRSCVAFKITAAVSLFATDWTEFLGCYRQCSALWGTDRPRAQTSWESRRVTIVTSQAATGPGSVKGVQFAVWKSPVARAPKTRGRRGPQPVRTRAVAHLFSACCPVQGSCWDTGRRDPWPGSS